LENTEFGGTGNIIGVDERNFGKRKYNKGRRVEGAWDFGDLERRTKKIFLIPVANR
jgi:hypothetical protein